MEKTKFQKFKYAVMNLTPAQQLHAQIVGYLGNMVGITFAGIVMLYKGMWYFMIVLSFTLLLQFVAYVDAKQKYKDLIEFDKNFNQEELIKKIQESEI